MVRGMAVGSGRGRKPSRRRVAAGGFTLVELLVVVAIIALLVSILVPSLRTAKELARRAYCAVNERSMGLGITMYAQDNLDATPPALIDHKDPNVAPWRHQWADFIVKYFDTTARPTVGGGGDDRSVANQPADGNHYRYWNGSSGLITSKTFDCPTTPNNNAREYSFNYSSAWAGQWYEGGSFCALRPDLPRFRVTKAHEYSAAEYIVVTEPGANFYLLNEWYNPSRTLTLAQKAPHLETANALYMDGHVSPYSKKQYEDWYYNTNHQVLPFYQPGLGPYCP